MSAKSIELTSGKGGLPVVKVRTPWSEAEIYLNGAHVTHFQKSGEPPLIFVSAKSQFAAGKAIRGGVPICFPWFGNRAGEPSHGFARTAAWQLVKSAVAPDGEVTLRFALPQLPGREAWSCLRTEFSVTVSETLTLGLTTANDSCDSAIEIENCLHTYFNVGDIGAVSLTGLQGTAFLDNAAGGNGARKIQEAAALRIPRETNRIYLDTISAVEIRDESLKRIIRVEKTGSHSTVVWNPWTTQKLPNDFDPAEHQRMVCVESGNVGPNKLSLAPGKSATLQVAVSSRAG